MGSNGYRYYCALRSGGIAQWDPPEFDNLEQGLVLSV